MQWLVAALGLDLDAHGTSAAPTQPPHASAGDKYASLGTSDVSGSAASKAWAAGLTAPQRLLSMVEMMPEQLAAWMRASLAAELLSSGVALL